MTVVVLPTPPFRLITAIVLMIFPPYSFVLSKWQVTVILGQLVKLRLLARRLVTGLTLPSSLRRWRERNIGSEGLYLSVEVKMELSNLSLFVLFHGQDPTALGVILVLPVQKHDHIGVLL